MRKSQEKLSTILLHNPTAGGGPQACKPLTVKGLPNEASYSARPANGKRVKLQVGDGHRPNPRGVAPSTDDCDAVG